MSNPSVKNSNGINGSDSINMSNGINGSDGINRSDGINESCGINGSDSINGSYGINGSDSINGSYGINESDGINGSYGVFNSFGVDKAIFLVNKPRTYSIFGKEVSKERFSEVWDNIYENANGWYPKFNNAFELYIKNGKDWAKIDASKITSKLDNNKKPYEAWKDMPEKLLDYIKGLPEFDSEMFKTITGIDVEKQDEEIIEIGGKKVSKQTIEEALKKYFN